MSVQIRQKKDQKSLVESPKLTRRISRSSAKMTRSRQIPILFWHIFWPGVRSLWKILMAGRDLEKLTFWCPALRNWVKIFLRMIQNHLQNGLIVSSQPRTRYIRRFLMRTQRWTCKFLCMDLFTFRTCEKMCSFEYNGNFFVILGIGM